MQQNDTGTSLITAGILAGPLYITLSIVQALIRDGFDMVRHPASLLSLGDFGWIQITNFVLSGLLFIACAIGIHKSGITGIGRKWLSRLIALMGIGLIMGGVFLADPALGFPAGAPEGVSSSMSWHAAVHGFAPIIGFYAQLSVLIIMARRFYRNNEKILMIFTVLICITTLVLISIPNFTADWSRGIVNFIPMWIGAALGYFYTSYVLIRLKANLIS